MKEKKVQAKARLLVLNHMEYPGETNKRFQFTFTFLEIVESKLWDPKHYLVFSLIFIKSYKSLSYV